MLIPPAKSPTWFALGAGVGTLATAIFLLFYVAIFGHSIDNLQPFMIFLLFLFIGELSALAGYFNYRLLAALSTLGLFAGITLLLSIVSRGPIGFEGLVGAIAMMMLIVCGFAAGIIAEIIKSLVKHFRKA